MSSNTVNRRTVLKGVSGASLAGLAGCITGGGDGTGTDAGDTIKIGLAQPLSGDFGFIGQNVLGSTEMMLKEARDHGGFDGRDIELITGDTQADPNEALSVAKKLLEVDNVDVLVGFTSLTIMQVVDRVLQAEIPWLVTNAGTAQLNEKGGDWMWRTWPSDDLAGVANGLSITQEKFNGVRDFERVGILTCKKTNCKAFLDPLNRTLDATGATVTNTVEITEGKGSYSTEIQRVTEGDPEVISVFASPDTAKQLIRSGFNAGYEGYWAGVDDIANKEFASDIPSELADRVIVSRSAAPKYVNDSVMSKWQKKFQNQTGNEPGLGWRASFDGVSVLLLAMKAALQDGSFDKRTVANNIPEMGRPPGTEVTGYKKGANTLEDGSDVNFQGLMTACNFTDKGNVAAPFEVFRMQEKSLKRTARIELGTIRQYIA